MNMSNHSEEMPSNKTADLYGTKSASLPPTPSKQMAGVKRQRKVDATKFNRSNRESKNCGTFYFKHSDTEPETGSIKHNGNDWSSQDATSELCSDEEWEYSKGSDVNGNTSNSHEDALDNDNLVDLSMQVNVNDSDLVDTVDSPFAHKQVGYQLIDLLLSLNCNSCSWFESFDHSNHQSFVLIYQSFVSIQVCESEKFEEQTQSTPMSNGKITVERKLYKEITKVCIWLFLEIQ